MRYPRLFEYVSLTVQKEQKLTFDFTVMERAGTFSLGAQSSPTREAQGPSQIRLVGALRARLARFEPVAGEGPCWTLAWIWFKKHRVSLLSKAALHWTRYMYVIHICPRHSKLGYLHRRRCFVPLPARGRHCQGRGHRPAAPPSPGKCRVDTGHSAPAHHGSKTPASIWLREYPRWLRSEMTLVTLIS